MKAIEWQLVETLMRSDVHLTRRPGLPASARHARLRCGDLLPATRMKALAVSRTSLIKYPGV